MKVCLDEHYSPRIAEELRHRGYDVDAVKERPDLRELGDPELWARMTQERRTLLTENVADFMPLVKQAALIGEVHSGVIFSSPRSMPRSAASIGMFVEALTELLRDNPHDGAFDDRVEWLHPSGSSTGYEGE